MISIIIPCFNNWNFTRNCLQNLSFLPPEKFEIIIVDNASTDQTSKEIQKFPFARHLRNEKNLGFGAAVNRGINESKGEHIMILNNDVKFGSNFKDWFLGLEKLSAENPNTLLGPTGGYLDPDDGFAFRYETEDVNRPINYLSGWMILASKETWMKLAENSGGSGPFDDRTFWLYFEDPDLCARGRIKKIDQKLISTPLVHIGKQTSKMIDTYKHYSISKEKFLKKWGSQKYLFRVS